MPAPRTAYRGGHRYYIHPDRQREYPGVTSVLDVGIAKQKFLVPWAAGMSAELAVDLLTGDGSREYFAKLIDRDRRGAVDLLKGASARYTKSRSDLGTEAHKLFERMIRDWGSAEDIESFRRCYEHVHPDVEDHRDHFVAFLLAVNPELIRAEEVVWSDTHGYAGSYDVVIRVWILPDGTPDPTRKIGVPVVIMVDWKTGKDLRAEVGVQLSAYTFAEVTIDADGVEHEMPHIDGLAALHITDKTWSLHPIKGDMRDHFRTFLRWREDFDWLRDVAPTMIGKPIAAAAGRLITGTERRA